METRRQKRARQNAEWRQALAEGRVLRFNDGLTFQSYPTEEECQIAYQEAAGLGITVMRIRQ